MANKKEQRRSKKKATILSYFRGFVKQYNPDGTQTKKAKQDG